MLHYVEITIGKKKKLYKNVDVMRR